MIPNIPDLWVAAPVWLQAAGCLALGAVLASCAVCLAGRAARGASLVTPSSCPACGTGLAAWQLVPVLGYALQRGRCRACASPIDPASTRWELALGLTCLLLCPAGGFGPRTLPDIAGLALCVYLAEHDRLTGLIPDRPLQAGCVLHPACLLASGAPVLPGLAHAALACATLSLMRRFWRGRHHEDCLGAGDVRFACLMGLMLDARIFAALALAGLYGLAAARLMPGARNARSMHFGPCLALGTMTAMVLPLPF